jgi:hypothetical protein
MLELERFSVNSYGTFSVSEFLQQVATLGGCGAAVIAVTADFQAGDHNVKVAVTLDLAF